MQELFAFLPSVPGGLLAWSLSLTFVSVVFAVLGAVLAMHPATELRRLGRSTELSGPAVGAVSNSAAAESSANAKRFHDGQVAVAVLLLLSLFFGCAWLVHAEVWSWAQGVYAAGVSAVLVWIIPNRLRAWRVSRRRDALRRGFPDALDMMVVCVEAGLGLDAALNRVAVEIAQAHPPISVELVQVGRELRAGRERGTVLRNFAHRTGLPEIVSFATLLIQSESLGTGIARSLRVQADEMRASRMLQAEEQAHTLPVKLTIPLVFCILPAMIAVVLLPSAIAIMRDILPNLGR